MTDPKNESFTGAMVNRVWKHYLGRRPGRAGGRPAGQQPADEPRAVEGAEPRVRRRASSTCEHLMRLILNSRTYQLARATRPGNETDARFYSHYYARRLPAEVLLDAIAQATGVPGRASPATRSACGRCSCPTRRSKSYFLTLFGRSERVTACACERNGEVTHAAAAAPAKRRVDRAERSASATAGWRLLLKETADRRAAWTSCSWPRCRRLPTTREAGR